MRSTCYAQAMAKMLQIRNVPDAVHRTLRVRAAEAGLSLSDYLLKEVVRVAARSDVAEALERSATFVPGLSTRSIVNAVRQGRRERETELYPPAPARKSRVAER